MGDGFAIAVGSTGRVVGFGENSVGQSTIPAGLVSAKAISAGGAHSVAVDVDGRVWCWGSGEYGGTSVPADLPAAVDVAAGIYFTAAALADGTVRCWGINLSGQCNVPPELRGVAEVDSSHHTLALRTDGSVAAWGNNQYGQASVPAGLPIIRAVSAGAYFSVALTDQGQVIAWGNAANSYLASPSGLGPVRSIAAGEDHIVSVLEDGSVRCWGFYGWNVLNVPTALPPARKAIAGPKGSGAMFDVGAINLRTQASFVRIEDAVYAAESGDVLIADPAVMDDEDVDYRGKSVELRSLGSVNRATGTLTVFAPGSRLAAADSISLAGAASTPGNASVTISAGAGVALNGLTAVAGGGSLLVNSAASDISVGGALALGPGAMLASQSDFVVGSSGLLQAQGASVVSEGLSTEGASQLVATGGTLSVGSLSVGGTAALLGSTVVGTTSISATGEITASGQWVGDAQNAGRFILTDDLVLSGDLVNQAGGTVLAQRGVLYITGSIQNNGLIFGNVITAPGFNGGGGGGTQPGDGIRVAGSLTIGPAGALRFVEELWKFSVCGDVSLACAADDVRFNGAKLALEGCDGTVQTLEATSRDLGCVASAFSGEETQVSLIGELDVLSGATVSLADNFNNAAGKSDEVVYARGLTVQPGATLLTNGIKVVTRNALIQGTVDDTANICVVPDLPDPDVNADGHVNGIDLAFILTYWGTTAPIADLNDDGAVNGADLAILLGGWTG
jgi:hypothetical protein